MAKKSRSRKLRDWIFRNMCCIPTVEDQNKLPVQKEQNKCPSLDIKDNGPISVREKIQNKLSKRNAKVTPTSTVNPNSMANSSRQSSQDASFLRSKLEKVRSWSTRGHCAFSVPIPELKADIGRPVHQHHQHEMDESPGILPVNSRSNIEVSEQSTGCSLRKTTSDTHANISTRDKVSDVRLPDYRLTVEGSQSQASVGSYFQGYQCTSMALTSIIAHKHTPAPLWTAGMINRILWCGDSLHEFTCAKVQSRDLMLAQDELPTKAADCSGEWPIHHEFQPILAGHINYVAKHSPLLLDILTHTLKSALHKFESLGADGCVFTAGLNSISILFDRVSGYRVFDSHSRDHQGKPVPDGNAVLLYFPGVDTLINFLSDKYTPSGYFNMMGVKVSLK